MKNIKLLWFGMALIAFSNLFSQNVNVQLRVSGLRHNYDCGNDGVLGDQPDPRWRLWGGHSGANYTQYTGAVATCGGNTISRDSRACGLVNDFTPFLIANFTNISATVVNADMECWEEDGCSGNCTPDNCSFPTFNSDDIHSVRGNFANITFMNFAPCTFTNVGTYMRDAGNGYGADLEVYWEYVSIVPGSVTASQTLCAGLTPAALTNVTSASTYAAYQWESSPDNLIWSIVPGATSANYSPPALTATTYYRRQASTCTAPVVYSNTVTITVDQITSNPTTITPSSITVCGTGTVSLAVSGGTLGTGANWNWYIGGCGSGSAIGTGSVLSSVNVTATTTYYVRGEGTCGNSNCANITISTSSLSTDPSSASATSTSICLGLGTNINVNGGSLGTGAQWQWYSGSCGGTSVGSGASINVTPTTTTTYFVRGESACGNTTCQSVTVNVGGTSVPPTTATVSANSICPGVSTTLSITGGTLSSGDSWVWSTGGCGVVTVGGGSTLTVSPSVTTVYYVRAQGTCGNTSCAQVTLNVNPVSTIPTSVLTTTNNFCVGGSTTLSLNGGALVSGTNWAWYENACGSGTSVGTGTAIVVSPTVNTTYYVRSEGGACGNTACTNIAINTSSLSTDPVSATATSTNVCLGVGTNMSVNGGSLGSGAQWQWYQGSCGGVSVGSGNSINVTPATTTTYFVRAEGTCGNTTCQTVTISVGAGSSAPASASVTASTICPSDTTKLYFNGGTLASGDTWVWYTGGCGAVPVGVGDTLAVWPSSSTLYYVRGVGQCGSTICRQIQVNVNSGSIAPLSVQSSTNNVCVGGSSTLTTNGGSLVSGANWTWYENSCGTGAAIGTGSTIVVSPTANTTYYVRSEGGVCGNSSCTNISIITNSLSSNPISVAATSTNLCLGDGTNMNVNGGSLGTGAQWQWYTGSCGGVNVGSGASINVTPAVTTTYFVRAEGTCGNTTCQSITINVGNGSQAPSSANVTVNSICPGSMTKVYLTGGVLASGDTWTWYTGGCGAVAIGVGDTLQVTPTTSTTYYVRGTGACGNSSCVQVLVNVNSGSPAPLSILSSNNNFCVGGNTTLSINGGTLSTGASWKWYENSCGAGTSVGTGSTIVVSPTVNTTYYVRSEGGVCGNSDCTNLPVTVLTTYAYIVPMDSMCGIGMPFALNNGIPQGGTYSGTAISANMFNPSIAGYGTHNIIYSYTASNGCVATATSNIIITPSNLAAQYTTKTKSCTDGGVTIDLKVTGGSGLYNYFWSNGESTPIINYVNPGTYSVTVIDGRGCSTTLNDIVITDDLGCINVPNAFTPNGDGVNDVWNVNLSAYTNTSLQVYSKWGQNVYDKTDAIHAWDGKHQGNDLPVGTYYYVIKYNDDQTQTGTITIVR